MRIIAAIVGVLTVACTGAGSDESRANPSSVSIKRAPLRAKLILVENTCGDSSESDVEFQPDGDPSDPSGISPLALWDEQTVKAIENDLPPFLGSEPSDRENAHWEHELVRADGTRIDAPNDLDSYRIHDGDTDSWRWTATECGAP